MQNIAYHTSLSVRGTLLIVNSTWPDGHVLSWQSQPLIRDVGAGNLLIATVILFCGLKLLNLAMFGESIVLFIGYRRNMCFLLYTLTMLCSKMLY